MTPEEQLPDADNEQLYPVKNTLLSTFRQSANWKCLILTTLILGCLGAIVWCRMAEVTKIIVNFSHFPITKTYQSSPCDDGYIYIPIAFVITLYMVYLVECWHCSTRIDLKYKVDAGKVYEMISSVKESLPVVWWKAICYHYVRRSRQVTRYRNGDAYTSTQVYYERINSHSASASFVFAHCGVKDISKKLVDLERYPATKIRFSKGFAFANIEAAAEFEDQRARFFQENERRDDYMEMREGLDLTNVNFKEFLIAFANPDHLPWYMSNSMFWVASFLLVSWPLRLLVGSRTAYVHYQVTKMFGVHYLTNRCNNYTLSLNNRAIDRNESSLVSPASTVANGELEWHIRTNLGSLLPSYSEALLMESVLPGEEDFRQSESICNDGTFADEERGNRLSRARSSSHLYACAGEVSRGIVKNNNGGSCNIYHSNPERAGIHRHRHSWTQFHPRPNALSLGSDRRTTDSSGGNGYLGLRPSITRLSLHNGHVLYHPLALWESLPSSTSFHRHPVKVARNSHIPSSFSNSNINNNINNNLTSSFSATTPMDRLHTIDPNLVSPPDYDVAIQVSRPLSFSTVQLLRRSHTDREIQLILQRTADLDSQSDNNNNNEDNSEVGPVRIVLDKGETAL